MEKKSIIPASSIPVTLSADAADRLIRRGDGLAALLYLYILRSDGVNDEAKASAALHRGVGELRAAFRVLEEEGLVLSVEAEAEKAPLAAPARQPRPLPEDKLPEYTAAEIKGRMATDEIFSLLAKEVQSALGKILSSDDLLRLYGIYDSLGLPPEVILHLVNHCIRENQRRSGPGRRPTMRYIERAAYEWEREGVTSLDLAEAYIRRHERLRGDEEAIAAAMGIQGRALTATESAYIRSWLEMGFVTDAVAEAYDRTVIRTGRLSWKYMDTILKSWHSKGLHTIEEIQRGDGRPARPQRTQGGKSAAPSGPPPRQSATMEDFERMKRYLDEGSGEPVT